MSDKLTRMQRSGEISMKAGAKVLSRPGIFQSTKSQQSKMVPFASKRKDEARPTGNDGALDRREIDKQSTPSNMSKGASAGPESQPARSNHINSGKGGASRDAGSRIRERNRKNRYNNKGRIYPSGPLAGGPNGRP